VFYLGEDVGVVDVVFLDHRLLDDLARVVVSHLLLQHDVHVLRVLPTPDTVVVCVGSLVKVGVERDILSLVRARRRLHVDHVVACHFDSSIFIITSCL